MYVCRTLRPTSSVCYNTLMTNYLRRVQPAILTDRGLCARDGCRSHVVERAGSSRKKYCSPRCQHHAASARQYAKKNPGKRLYQRGSHEYAREVMRELRARLPLDKDVFGDLI